MWTGEKASKARVWLARKALGGSMKGTARNSSAPDFLTAELPSGNLVTTAFELSRFYEILRRGGELDGVRIMEPGTLREALTPMRGPGLGKMSAGGYELGGRRVPGGQAHRGMVRAQRLDHAVRLGRPGARGVRRPSSTAAKPTATAATARPAGPDRRDHPADLSSPSECSDRSAPCESVAMREPEYSPVRLVFASVARLPRPAPGHWGAVGQIQRRHV